MSDPLARLLTTDPRDAGCERAVEALHVYVELVASGADPEARYPGIAAHLRACGPCFEDYQGLLALVQ
jgi:hypothetical protein